MPIDKNVSPYYDDFSASKKFYQILFRPAHAVQARELSQIQSLLQHQVSNLADHLFEKGAMVIPGQIAYDSNYTYVKIQPQFLSVDVNVNNFLGKTITGQTSGVVATVINVVDIEGSDPKTLYIKYINSGTSNTTKVFANNEELWTDDLTPIKCKSLASSSTGTGSAATIKAGVYYINGYMADVDSQVLILDKYTNTPTYRVGLEIIESLVDSNDDPSLNDQAQGTPNYLAPGADRYKIELTLSKKEIESTEDQTFVELLRLSDGVIQLIVNKTDYSVLEDTLARRTYDESGNYTVRAFGIDVREHLNDGSNRGIYLSGNGGDATKLAIGLEPGKAYVNGYEIQNVATTFIATDKARDTQFVNNSSTPANIGNYILIKNMYNFPTITNFDTLSLRDTTVSTPGTAPGSQIGTARVRAIELHSGTAGDSAAQYKLYLFDIVTNSNKTFADDVKAISLAGSPAFTANVVLNGASEAEIYSSAARIPIFALPQLTVQKVRSSDNSVDTTYSVRRQFTGTTDGSGNITFNAGTDEVFVSFNTTDYFLAITSGGSTGTIIDLSGKVTLGGSPVGKSVTVALTGTYASVSVKMVGTVTKQVAQEKTKTLQTDSLNVTSPGSTVGLGRADIYRIVGIYDSGNGSVNATTSDTNITTRYTLDNGQRDNYYGIGSITLNSGETAPTGRILVQFEYFSHGSGDYFSVDSYTGQISYGNIPSFTSSTGQYYRLSDCLDFRPRLDNTGANFTGTGASLIEVPKPQSSIRADFSYYLNRIDKVVVNSRGEFHVIKGTSGVNPNPPADLADAMTLYKLYIRAYTFNTNDVISEIVENRRYTMRDIGALENRITNLEYYTSLSLLEKSTSSLQIVDNTTGLERYKNGFVVDNFKGHGVGDVLAADYRCSVDPTQGVVRPAFIENNVKLVFDEDNSSNFAKTGDLITLPFTDTIVVSQTAASRTENINPYAIFAFRGSVALVPESDDWRDTERLPDTNVTLPDQADLIVDLAARSGISGTNWNQWQTTWAGVQTVLSQTTQDRVMVLGGNVGGWAGHWPVRYDTVTTTVSSQQVGQMRTGTVTSVVPQTVSQSIGDRIVNLQIVPFMRSIDVDFTGTRLRPSTRVYPFFDGVDIGSYCKPTGGSLGQALITDASGKVSGTFTVPNTDTVRFRTGQRVFKLTDSNTNSTDASTQAEATFSAQGVLETRQNTVVSTRVAQVNQQQVNENRVITNVSTSTTTIQGAWFDPLAQTFLLEDQGGTFLTKLDLYFSSKAENIPVTVQIRNVVNGYPGPLILPFSEVTLEPGDVDVSTDASVATTFTFPSPVYLMPRTEYCFVVLADTTEYEIYVGRIGEYQVGTDRLISQQPYAGVMFKSQNASTWTPDQTQDITFRLHKAVFDTGVTGTVTLTNDAVGTKTLSNNPFTTTNSSTSVRVYHPGHGMSSGSTVTIAGVPSGTYNNIPYTELNGNKTISSVEFDYYTITTTTAANAAGDVGGTAVTATYNVMMDVYQPNIQQTLLPGTSSIWGIKAASAKAVHGSQTPYVLDSTYTVMQVSENNRFQSPHQIASTINETNNLSGSKSLFVQGLLASSNENISPVIDTQRISMTAISNIIDNADNTNVANFVAETQPTLGSAMAKYITRKVTLKDPAIALKVYLTANIPTEASVDIYYKTLSVDETAGMDTLNWVLMNPETPYVKLDNPDQFIEYSYIADSLDPFIAFAIKVVMKTTDSTDVPKVADFRAIALGT